MASAIYNYFKKAVLQGSLNLATTGNMKPYFTLVGSGYTPDVDTHLYRSSLTNEITGSNWAAGGYALSSPTITQDDTNNQGVFDAADVLLANVTFNTNPQAAVIYGSSGLGIASDPLFGYIDFGATYPVTAGTFQITWASGGILALT